jgi:hypothetical protein
MNFTERNRIEIAIAPAAGVAGTSDINGASCDLQGCLGGVTAIVQFGAITSTAVTSIKGQESADNSTWADLEGTAQTVADDDDELAFVIEVTRPLKRYFRVVVDRGTANAVVASAVYIVSGLRESSPTHGTGVAVEMHHSPAAGTA